MTKLSLFDMVNQVRKSSMMKQGESGRKHERFQNEEVE